MHCFLLAASWLFPLTADPPRTQANDFESTGNYQVRQVAGWTVLIHPALPKEHAVLLDETLEQLEHQLYQVKRAVPAAALAKVKTVKIWIENFHYLQPCMCYHPSADWLRLKRCNLDKANCVEIANPRNFVNWTHEQPYMVVHELAHAYHHQFTEDGYDNREIRKAYDRARETKKYQDVMHVNGSRVKAYAMTNPMEYFAECSEAYFGTNDFYPFVRSELREHDPDMFAVLEKMWRR